MARHRRTKTVEEKYGGYTEQTIRLGGYKDIYFGCNGKI